MHPPLPPPAPARRPAQRKHAQPILRCRTSATVVRGGSGEGEAPGPKQAAVSSMSRALSRRCLAGPVSGGWAGRQARCRIHALSRGSLRAEVQAYKVDAATGRVRRGRCVGSSEPLTAENQLIRLKNAGERLPRRIRQAKPPHAGRQPPRQEQRREKQHRKHRRKAIGQQLSAASNEQQRCSQAAPAALMVQMAGAGRSPRRPVILHTNTPTPTPIGAAMMAQRSQQLSLLTSRAARRRRPRYETPPGATAECQHQNLHAGRQR